MKTSNAAHLTEARKKEFTFAADPRLFTEAQYDLVRRWGHWYAALTEGRIQPLNDAHRAFLAAVKGGTPPDEPHAEAWWRYCKRLAIEAKDDGAMHSTHQFDTDTFYSREMVKKLKSTMRGVVTREHRR
jgi:uncharacterized protein YifE (UPF0438 family)